MNAIPNIEQRRENILNEMRALRSLCAASLSEQMLPVKHKGKKEPVMRGPYFVLSHRQEGKTRSRRVRAEELEQVKKDVANHEHFVALSKEFVELTQRLGELERAQEDDLETLKKTRKLPSSKTGR